MSTLALTVLALVVFVGLLLFVVAGLALAGLAYLTHRHPRLERPLNIAGQFAGVLVALAAVLLAVVALVAR
ncbi:hypothetical protein [Streptomyces sp. RTGN2]|uniref:hypothetical protein n=1 Tax=Streptomyces sp. RTGN2 TaxID=3016525 RepID=UPI002552917B|nr:hypothetical protein [Streptomyces sp. RTGN2]